MPSVRATVSPNNALASSGRAAIYTRVSTQEQSDHGYSLGAQEQDCRRLAEEELHLDIVAIFQDTDSGASWDLPGLIALLDAAKRRDFEAVLVYDPDRLARRMAKQLVIEEELKRSDIGLKYVTLRLGDTAEDQLLKNVRGSIAEYERTKIALRTSRGRRAKAERGTVVGTGVAPYGYRYTRDASGRVDGMEPDAITAPVVQRIFTDLLKMPVNALCDRLDAESVPTYFGAKRWGSATILGIVRSPVYLGTAAYGRRDAQKRWRDSEAWLTCPVPAIIDATLAAATREALTDRRKRGAPQHPEDDPYLLRGLLTCGHCGGQLSICPVTSPQGRVYRYYVCLRHQPARRERAKATELCPLPPISGLALEAEAWRLVSALLLDPEALAAGLALAREQRCSADHRRAERVGTLNKEIERLRNRLKRITSERFDAEPGSESERALKALAQDAEAVVARLVASKAELDAEPSVGLSDDEIASLQRFASEMRADIGQATDDEKRKIYDVLRLRATLRHDPEKGQKFGRDNRFAIEWQAEIEITNGAQEYKKTRVTYFSPELDEWHLCHHIDPVAVSV